MATYIVGTPKPKRLGKNYLPASALEQRNPNAMFYVVNRNAQYAMQGLKAIKVNNITCYAVFTTRTKAEQYLKETRRNLIACVVEL